MGLFLVWSSFQRRNPVDEDRRKAPPKVEEVVDAQGISTFDPEQPLPEAVEGKQEIIAIGSMNPNDGYKLLVTLNSRGAGIERIELVEQSSPGKLRYRSLGTRGGWIGYLSFEETEKGLKARSIPRGSPADAAVPPNQSHPVGLQVGDHIIALNDSPVATIAEWEKILGSIRPGRNVPIKVRRELSDGSTLELTYSVTLMEKPLDVVRITDELAEEQVVGNEQRLSLLTTISSIDGRILLPSQTNLKDLDVTLNGNWLAKPLEVPEGTGVEFTLPLEGWLAKSGTAAKIELVKRYRLLKAQSKATDPVGMGYCLDVETVIRNLDHRAHQVAIRQEGVHGLTLESWWYAQKISPYFFDGAGIRDVVFSDSVGGHQLITRNSIFKYATGNPNAPEKSFFSSGDPVERRSFRYLGVDTPYFVSALIPHPEQPDGLSSLAYGVTRPVADPSKFVSGKALAGNVGFWFETAKANIEGQAEVKHRYMLFAGPKDPSVLQVHGLSGCIEFGWFGFIAKPLLMILHLFYSIVRNYGIAIIMLTILVRGCMFPISRKAALSAQKMQDIAPELKALNELYKDDPQRKIAATREVYKKHKFNPASGCLPVFLQIPIFIGLYRAVSIDIELRQQPLIPGLQWCSNLAGPDMLHYWGNYMIDFIAGKGSGWFGPYFNILPILTITLFIIQQKVLMPKATDEQTRLTQKMMMYMTIFMGVLFFKVPAGLCIYFITSSLWSLVERRLIKKHLANRPTLAIEMGGGGTAAEHPKKYVPDAPAKVRAPKPPEKLSDIFPWLAKPKPNGQASENHDEPTTLRDPQRRQRRDPLKSKKRKRPT